jgi:lysine 6-dehydrogenase
VTVGFNYVVLGAGRQGAALTYALAKNCEAERVTVADVDRDAARRLIARLKALLPSVACDFVDATCDVSNPSDAIGTLSGADVVLSAVPYRFNAPLTEAAITARTSFCDLGGNTQVVRQQLANHDRAIAAGVSVVPDCGLAPGLGNILAAHGVAELDEPEDVRVRCGGLPEKPVGPLGYKLTFSFEGLINEYSGCGQVLRDGKRLEIPALTEIEEIEFPPPLGVCEAAVTSGGASTAPDTFSGRLRSYGYKTVRYPGHFATIRALFGIGCFEDQVTLSTGEILEPRRLMRQLMEQRLAFPEVHDLVVMRCTVSGRHGGQSRTLQYDLLDRHDDETGFSAMERATAFPAALVAYMQARRLIDPGARPLEVAVPVKQYLDELPQQGVPVKVRG